MLPSGFTLAMTLTLNFQNQIFNLLYLIILRQNDLIATNKKMKVSIEH